MLAEACLYLEKTHQNDVGTDGNVLAPLGFRSKSNRPLTAMVLRTDYLKDWDEILAAELPSEWFERYERELGAIVRAHPSDHLERSEPSEHQSPKPNHSESNQPSQATFLTETGSEHPERLSDENAKEDHLDFYKAFKLAASIPERSEQLTLTQIVEHLTPIMKEIAVETCRTILQGNHTASLVHGEDEPPLPETTGRKQSRSYGKIATTLDRELIKLFNAECKRRQVSSGRLLDIILWRHYGRPQLSYELKASRSDQEEAIERPDKPLEPQE